MDQVKNVLKPTLHVEARVKSNGNAMIICTDIVRDEVARWLIENFAILNLGQEISVFGGLNGTLLEDLDTVKVTECSGPKGESEAYRLDDVHLDVQAYQLRSVETDTSHAPSHGVDASDNDSPHARVTPLPNQELDGIWESRALAQKLAIRLGRQFPQSNLVEITANSLGSKYFSESGKLVAKAFTNIESMLNEEPDTLVCVFIDEVETIAARREHTLNGNDPLDSMRAVNSVLTALDRLRRHSNVVVLCTSNLLTALDSAFLDRIDIKQFIPSPAIKEIYEIFRSCLQSLSECGLIQGETFDVVPSDANNPETPLKYISGAAPCLQLPTYGEMLLGYQLFPRSVPKLLADVSEMSIGLSGRALRRIPVLSLVFHGNSTPCSVSEAISALRCGIEDELKAKQEVA
ncbi:hypothetical protein FQN57_003283, partial [Myotisia sp. PD_48]